jgi:hypothetical protein
VLPRINLKGQPTMSNQIPSIQVWAANEKVRKNVIHPMLPRVKFPEDINQPLSWPDDSFTKTLLRDREILLEPPNKILTGTIAADAEVAPTPKKTKAKE